MFQIPQLLKFPDLIHAFSETSDGNMSNFINGKDIKNFGKVLNNRKTFFKRMCLDDSRGIVMWVEHKDKIIEAKSSMAGRGFVDYNFAVKCDGIYTDIKGIFLFLLTADCMPLIIYDKEKSAIALLHVGWKGADLNIAGKTIDIFKEKYKSKPKDLIVGIGPCARKDSYIKKTLRN